MERTITLHIDETRILQPTRPQLEQAIGRLAMYSNYPEVHIYNDGANDLVAVYKDDANERKFVIGAVWRPDEGKYTYHS
jgi:hypothetical protein